MEFIFLKCTWTFTDTISQNETSLHGKFYMHQENNAPFIIKNVNFAFFPWTHLGHFKKKTLTYICFFYICFFYCSIFVSFIFVSFLLYICSIFVSFAFVPGLIIVLYLFLLHLLITVNLFFEIYISSLVSSLISSLVNAYSDKEFICWYLHFIWSLRNDTWSNKVIYSVFSERLNGVFVQPLHLRLFCLGKKMSTQNRLFSIFIRKILTYLVKLIFLTYDSCHVCVCHL